MKLYLIFLFISLNVPAQTCLSDLNITQPQFSISYTKSATYIELSCSLLSSASITVDAHKGNGYIELFPGFISSPTANGEFVTKFTYICDFNNRLLGNENVVNNDLSVIIYPNPNNGEFFISGIKDKSILKVSSVEGKLLETKEINNNSLINLNLANGVYLFHIVSEKTINFKKIIID